MTIRPSMLPAAALLCAFLATPADAAESYDGCTATLTSLPTVITTQGTWCMDKDLATAMSAGVAVDINAHNVTLDCNGFKLGGLAAGASTGTVGIRGVGKTNTTIRNCNIRGFMQGIWLSTEGGAHVVEDNRFDGNTLRSIQVTGDGSAVRRNLVLNTGGRPETDQRTIGILAGGSVQVVDNQVQGVAPDATAPTSEAVGIMLVAAPGGRVAGNLVGQVLRGAAAGEYGIVIYDSDGVVIRGNDIHGSTPGVAVGISCQWFSASAIRDNTVLGTNIAWEGCIDLGGNAAD